jgi:hypothetical protein
LRYLLRVADDRPFAYAATRRDFFLVSDDSLWAHESHSWLLSAASSATLARRIGGTYYDSETGEPLFYEATDAPAPAPNAADVEPAPERARKRRRQ